LAIALESHGAFVPGITANNQTEYTPKLVPAGQYTVTETMTAGWQMRGVTVSGDGCREVVPEDLFEALESQLVQALHLLQFESAITFVAEPGAACLVTFENERLVATIVVEKVYVGAAGDPPELALEVDGSPVA